VSYDVASQTRAGTESGGTWRKARLDQLGRIVTGKTPPSSIAGCFGGSLPFVTPSDMDARRTIRKTERFLSERGLETVAASRIPPGSVMVSCIGSDMGKAAIAGRDCVTNQQINSLIVDSNDDPLFIYYNLRNRRQELRAIASGSAQPILNKSAFGQVEILLPPLGEQRDIASAIGALDDKIELNGKMCETLEAIARSIFKSWFVNFDPVRAKAEGRDPGLRRETAALFPDSFRGSEFGELPSGWQMVRLGEVLGELVSGSRPRGGATLDGIPSIGAENILGLSRYDFSREKYVPRDFFRQLEARGAVVRNGDVLLYKDGAQIGRKSFFDRDFPHRECAINEHVFILRPNNPTLRRYLFFWLDLPWMTNEIIALNSNSAQPGINQAGVRSLPLLVPESQVLRAFDDAAGCLMDALFNLCKESRKLGFIRDALLPKLVSGKLRVSDAYVETLT
jgi:type I restriction enzyme S subunit